MIHMSQLETLVARSKIAAAAIGFSLITLGPGNLPLQAATVSAPLPAPKIVSVDNKTPSGGLTLSGLGTTITWENPLGASQYHVQLIPYNNDGPGINLIKDIGTSFTIAPPDTKKRENFVMLPGMEYNWQIRTSNSKTAASESSGEWGEWAKVKFRTPVPAYSLEDLTSAVSGAKPIFRWRAPSEFFYFEIQVSPNSDFSSETWRWHNLVHGGNNEIENTWVAPENLKTGKYFWRVRPRVQGDAAPLPWGPAWSFSIDDKLPSESIIAGVAFHNYNGNNLADADEPVVSSAEIRFRNQATGETVTAKTDSHGKYSAIIKQGNNEISVSAISPKSREPMKYLLSSNSESYRLDSSKKYVLSVRDSIKGFNVGLAEGSLTLPYAKESNCLVVYPYEGPQPAHDGLDIQCKGKDILAADGGIVRYAGHLKCEGETVPNYVVGIQHPDDTYTLYKHLEAVSVAVGMFVERGSKVGTYGMGGLGGCSREEHLHFGFGVGSHPEILSSVRNPDNNWTEKGKAHFSR